MKYIDVEKLKELLDAKYKEFTEKAKKDCPLQYQYMADGLDIAEQFIDSLQQEQPEFPTKEEIKKMAYKAYPISDRPSPEEIHDKALLQEGYIRAYNDLEYTSRFRRLSLPMVERIVILAQGVEDDFCDDEERTFYDTEDIAREVIKRLEEKQ